ncbi:MAG TPA: tRNA (adenosine(37)-N6)-threonylcarbamoyltransferase complex ATPase subunit type 1 TsaE [Flavobacteriales bacterium]|nr:tRNA (adenosine(37)-N6)-threonylcarbamoyltransferase complex ATPase subunit type 1 TsaE [Flavobacteriales bacterium]HMR26905.1 tRNA (adenosine(37)-N6)-threonylcarbamoyltransferase complex ATPase subunit type 1 TsaE [Flavobacteriales bacterium]
MSTILVMQRPEEAAELAAAMLHACPQRRVFAFRGELGAGKTTFIKALCAELGVEDEATSPSFALVNEYRSERRGPVYHFDLFRLKDARELEGIGFGEYIDSGSYCFVEWPELAKGQLPADTVQVRFEVITDGTRTIHLEP